MFTAESKLNSHVDCGQKTGNLRALREISQSIYHILNGSNAEPGTHPWHVSLSYQGIEAVYDFCGATLISPTAVITGVEINFVCFKTIWIIRALLQLHIVYMILLQR